MSCTTCEMHGGLERVRYFSRQLITADDMNAEQTYFRQRLRRHNKFMHGWGVVCGSDVKAAPTADRPWLVRVCPGYVLGPHGDEIMIGDDITFDLSDGTQEGGDPCAQVWPCPPGGNMPSLADNKPTYLAIRYSECDSRPQHVNPRGCSCNDGACEYSRTRDSFELRLLWELPSSHVKAKKADKLWCAALAVKDRMAVTPVPPCPECPDDPWVVLARIILPQKASTAIADTNIGYQDRRVLYSTSALQVAMNCP